MSSSLRCKYENIDELHRKVYPPPKLCANCKKVAYCSKRCQVADWDSHVFDCPGAKISTAHYLMKAVREDLMPTDAQTCNDWGITRAGPDGNMVLGLFQGLRILMPGLRAHDLRMWKKDGILIRKIKEEFERLDPRFPKGQYYPWFLENEWVLDTSLPIPPDRSAEAHVRRMQEAFIAYVGHDIPREEMRKWSARRQECHFMCHSALTRSRPSPHSPGWISFGFCVARDGYEEMQIGNRYASLFLEKRCPFPEFCDAHESASMFALLEKYGVASAYRHFEHVLGQTTNESVWNLKEALLAEETPPRSVLVDYGFINCRTTEERMRLVDVYKGMLLKPGFDEMDLHAACLRGEILEYAEGILKFEGKEKKVLARLMKSPYPLPDA